MGLEGRYIDIAGSANDKCDIALLRHCHRLIRSLTRGIVNAGGGVVAALGEETLRLDGEFDTARVFYWTILDEVHNLLHDRIQTGEKFDRPVVKMVCTKKARQLVPPHRTGQLDDLLQSNAAELRVLKANWNTAAYVREHQAREGDALVVVGGGEGVEHLALLHAERNKPVIPLDADIGAYHQDGNGGALKLYDLALAMPDKFVAEHPERFPGELQCVSVKQSNVDLEVITQRLLRLLDRVVVPRVFFVRATNPDVTELAEIDAFFRDVVTPVVESLGYKPYEVGRSKSNSALIHTEIFDPIHHAAVVVADLTGDRPNNYIEFGYALGRTQRTVVAAKEGTKIPFDAKALPVHFWKTDQSIEERQRAFREFWQRNAKRGPIVAPREII